jgi:putative ATPase
MRKPLAFRMRPTTIDEVIGQNDLIGKRGFLTNSIKNKIPVSFILFGEPGTGKTTIAECYANSIGAHYVSLNAVTSNKKELMDAIEDAKNYECSIVIIDEIHRLNKDKQDILLPSVEDGTIYLIGATTANPYISINKAIRSRLHLLEVKRLSLDEVVIALKRACSAKKGLDNKINITDEALAVIASKSNGDIRFALNYLEILQITFGEEKIDVNEVNSIVKVTNSSIDNDENGHYDAVSALQKSIRGSDVNAALYYAGRILASGDLEALTRRLLVTAYEDVGIANPSACMRTKIAIDSAYTVGLPEAIIPLGVAIVDLALSPKSKVANNAIHAAYDCAQEMPLDVLDYLRLTPVNVRDEEKYPYDNPEMWIHMQYLPEIIKNFEFYVPNLDAKAAYEKFLNEQYKIIKQIERSNNLPLLRKKYTKK